MCKLAFVTGVEAVELPDGAVFISIGTKLHDLNHTEVFAEHFIEGDIAYVRVCSRKKEGPLDKPGCITGVKLVTLTLPGGLSLRKAYVRGINGTQEVEIR
ncbi:MAG: hypothetical protein KGZ75_01670 [Syntrophomonadaceae bacterium]|nr:hypothetical protein [Syntrophomonadaceae bacterium]